MKTVKPTPTLFQGSPSQRKGGRFTPSRSVLIEIIKFQTGINLTNEATKYFYLVDKWVKNEGITSATERLKMIYHSALNSYLEQPNPEHFNISTRKGFPRSVSFLRKFRTSPNGIQAALGLLGYYRGMVTKGLPKLDQITDQGVEIPAKLITEILLSTPESWKFDTKKLDPPVFLFRSKQGPNGQATLTSALDLMAIKKTSLRGHIDSYMKHINEDIFQLDLEDLEGVIEDPGGQYKTSRLSIKREGGGKTRVFAMVDYWTQCLLNPLHTQLAKILATIPRDCTFNQGRGVPDLKSWSNCENNYSFDLSSATDRFPLELQKQLLGKLTSQEYADSWANLMVDRDFIYRGKPYRWSVGQPLGAYSSWPMFALTHHLVVLRAAKVANCEPIYYLLGDDIVIHGHELAKAYKEIIATLGVDINFSKTLIGSPIEFAKRLFHKGVEISPAPVRMIQAFTRDPLLIREGLNQIISRGSIKFPDCALRLNKLITEFSGITGVSRDKVEILLTSPLGEGPLAYLGGFTSEGTPKWPMLQLQKTEIARIAFHIKYNYLMEKTNRLSSLQMEEYKAFKELPLAGLAPQNRQFHPANVGLTLQREQLAKAKRNLSLYESSADDLELPTLNTTSFAGLTPSNKARIKHLATVIEKTYESAKALSENLPIKEELRPIDFQSYLEANFAG